MAANLSIVISGDEASARKALGKIAGDLDKVGDSTDDANKRVSVFGDNAGQKFQAISTVVAGFAAALVAAFVGAGVALFKLGEEFESAYKTIRIGTGATGEVLDGLKSDFKNALGSVPDDVGTVATAIADLNTRTGASGETLQGLTKAMLAFTRVGGGDVQSNIALSTRLFGDWSIALEDSESALDKVFRASQATGIGTDKLMSQMVQFGAPLRQMGFSFEETAGFLSKFEKEGVNAELVMGSLRIALGKMARDGIPAREGLLGTMEAIKAAGSASEANAIALDLFGARAGPDMAAAIREGRFELGDLLGMIENGSDTVRGLAEETLTIDERFAMLGNQAKLAFEPAGTAILKVVQAILTQLIPVLQSLSTQMAPIMAAFGEQLQAWTPAVSQVVGVVRDTLSPVMIALGGTLRDNAGPAIAGLAAILGLTLLPVMIAVTGTIWAAALPFIPLVAAIAAVGVVVAVMAKVYQENFFGIRDATEQVIGFVAPFIQTEFGKVVGWFQANWPLIQQTVQVVMGAIQAVVTTVSAIVSSVMQQNGIDIMAIVQGAWDIIATIVDTVLMTMLDQITLVMQVITGDWEGAHETMRRISERAKDAILSVLGILASGLQSVISSITASMLRTWEGWKDAMIGAVEALITPIRQKADQFLAGISNAVSDATGAILSAVSTLAGSMIESVRSGLSGGLGAIQGAIQNTVSNAVEGAKNLIGGIASFAGTLVNNISSAIGNGVADVASSIRTVVSGAVSAASNGITGIGSLASSVINGIADNIRNGVGSIAAAVRDVVSGAIRAATGGIVGASTSSVSSVTSASFADVPFLAEGGIVSRPTLAVVGDAGPEAIVPLNKFGQYGGGGTVVININAPTYGVTHLQEVVTQAVITGQRRGRLSGLVVQT